MIPASELVSADALRRYDDSGDPVYTPPGLPRMGGEARGMSFGQERES